MFNNLSEKERTIVLIAILLTTITGLALFAASAINRAQDEGVERSQSPEPAMTH